MTKPYVVYPEKVGKCGHYVGQYPSDSVIQESERGALDMRNRMTILNAAVGGSPVVGIPLFMAEPMSVDLWCYRTYWSWYADSLRVDIQDVYGEATAGRFPKYPRINTELPTVMFTSDENNDVQSGGIESTFAKKMLYRVPRVNIVPKSFEHQDIGMLEGYLAILASSMGVATAFIGDEMYSDGGAENRVVDGETFADPYSLEQTETWWRMWNQYRAPSTIQSVAGLWHKDELILKVHELGELSCVTSCFGARKDQPWCRECFKCFITYVTLMVNRRMTPGWHELLCPTARTVEQIRAEYDAYKETGVDVYRRMGLIDRLSAQITPRTVWDLFELPC